MGKGLVWDGEEDWYKMGRRAGMGWRGGLVWDGEEDWYGMWRRTGMGWGGGLVWDGEEDWYGLAILWDLYPLMKRFQ